ncbi:hypothetical protein COLO4_20525 [Corchorus olitorius]|uniref:Uncharacterized protein n=1 Tax=Corchorus olitorius TaxID=93759 RepID=A0A1R3IZG8_9ROSI|nr:hypothetical protein COLO4_20525 [Corchorus olitorius]
MVGTAPAAVAMRSSAGMVAAIDGGKHGGESGAVIGMADDGVSGGWGSVKLGFRVLVKYLGF